MSANQSKTSSDETPGFSFEVEDWNKVVNDVLKYRVPVWLILLVVFAWVLVRYF